MDWTRIRNWVYLVLIVGITVACLLLVITPIKSTETVIDAVTGKTTTKDTYKEPIKLGLDLRSGSHIEVQLVPVVDLKTGRTVQISNDVANQSIKVYEKRLNPDGTKEVLIQQKGTDRLIIELPGETNLNDAVNRIKKVARLEFREQVGVDPKTNEPVWASRMDGRAIESATLGFDSRSGNPDVEFRLTKEGTKDFADLTTRLVNKPLGIFLDNALISAPTVQEPITGGSGIITLGGNSGGESPEKAQERMRTEAKDLADFLNAGALPVDAKVLETALVSPILGEASLKLSMWAAAVGLGLVILFMVWYYRLPGFVADLALIIYTIVLLGILVGFGVVLSLPGIAGFVLSIGMAVDANVLIFERIKEELWSDRSIRSSVEIGFKRAFSSILDSHVTTLIGALVLYNYGATSVKGFGLTLALGTIMSMVTAVFVTRVLMEILAENNILGSRRLYGA